MKKLNFSLVLIFVVALFCSLLPSDVMGQGQGAVRKVVDVSKVPKETVEDSKKRLPGKKPSRWIKESETYIEGGGSGENTSYIAEYEVAGKLVNSYKTSSVSPFSTIVSYDVQMAKIKFPDGVKKLQALLGASCIIELSDTKAAYFFTNAQPEEKVSSFSLSAVKGKTSVSADIFSGSPNFQIGASNCETTFFDDADLPALKNMFLELKNSDDKAIKTDISLADQVIKFKEISKKRGWSKAIEIKVNGDNALNAYFDNKEQTRFSPIMTENNKIVLELLVTGISGSDKKEIEYFKDSDKPKALFMEGKFYAIQSKKSGKYLDIPKNSKENGVNVVQFGGKMTPNEQFKFVKQADGSYKITAKHSNKFISAGEGGFLVQLDKGDDHRQNWTIKDAGNGFVTLELKILGTVADVYDGSVEDGGRIWAYNSNGSDAQLWKLIEVK